MRPHKEAGAFQAVNGCFDPAFKNHGAPTTASRRVDSQVARADGGFDLYPVLFLKFLDNVLGNFQFARHIDRLGLVVAKSGLGYVSA